MRVLVINNNCLLINTRHQLLNGCFRLHTWSSSSPSSSSSLVMVGCCWRERMVQPFQLAFGVFLASKYAIRCWPIRKPTDEYQRVPSKRRAQIKNYNPHCKTRPSAQHMPFDLVVYIIMYNYRVFFSSPCSISRCWRSEVASLILVTWCLSFIMP